MNQKHSQHIHRLGLLLLVGFTILGMQAAPARAGSESVTAEGHPIYIPVVTGVNDGPQGKRAAAEILFSSLTTGMPRLFVMAADGSSQTAVQEVGEAQVDPAWSPDNRHIAMSALTGYQPCDKSGRDCAVWDIVVMDSDGANIKNLTEPLGANSSRYPVWSPDGAQIAFASSDKYAGCEYAAILELSDPNLIKKTGAYGFLQDWSPDGRYLLTAVYDEPLVPGYCDKQPAGIYKYDLLQKKSTRVYAGPVHSASWAANGHDIAFSFESGIYIVQSDGSNVRKIATDRGLVTDLSWSPDAQWLTFTSEVAGASDIFKIQRDGRRRTQLTFTDSPEICADWSN